jgi:hypothetical protein
MIKIIQFGPEPLPEAHALGVTLDDAIRNTLEAFDGIQTPQKYTLGTQVGEKGSIQIMSDCDGVQDYKNLKATPELGPLVKALSNFYGEPQHSFHVALNRSAFGADGLAAAKVVEFVQNYFPASRITPHFAKQVEEDFLRFDDIYSKDAQGNLTLAFGWVLEDQEHENIIGEKAKCFFIARGWESMDHFEQSVKTDAYKKAIPLLFAWNASWKMVGPCFPV